MIFFLLYLKPAPVIDSDHIDILEAADDGDDHPGDQEAVVTEMSSKDEQQTAAHTKERVKHSVLDDGTDTNILKIQVMFNVSQNHLHDSIFYSHN